MGDTFKFILEYKDYIDNIFSSDEEKDEYMYGEILKRSRFNRLVINEGLIKTHPSDKSMEILKRKFPELILELQEDGEIFIENQPPHKISKYLPMITNLGYFISILTYDGNTWVKEYNEDSKPIAFKIEAKYDYEVDIPKKLYHTSPIRFMNKILKYGLTPKSGNKLTNHPERVYVSGNMENAVMFGEYLKNEIGNEWYDSGYCIYEVNGECIEKLYSDVNFRSGGYYLANNIKPGCITLLKTYKS